jgi:hypothetical protein
MSPSPIRRYRVAGLTPMYAAACFTLRAIRSTVVSKVNLHKTSHPTYPIRNTLVSHTPQLPRIANTPFRNVTRLAFSTLRVLRHFKQYPSTRFKPHATMTRVTSPDPEPALITNFTNFQLGETDNALILHLLELDRPHHLRGYHRPFTSHCRPGPAPPHPRQPEIPRMELPRAWPLPEYVHPLVPLVRHHPLHVHPHTRTRPVELRPKPLESACAMILHLEPLYRN